MPQYHAISCELLVVTTGVTPGIPRVSFKTSAPMDTYLCIGRCPCVYTTAVVVHKLMAVGHMGLDFLLGLANNISSRVQRCIMF